MKAVLSQEEFDELDENTASAYEYNGERSQYELSWDVVKDHPGLQKVKRTADENKKSASQLQKERDQLRKRFGPLADAEGIDLSDVDEESLQPVIDFLKGERKDLGDDGGKDGQDGKGKRQEVDLEKVKANARKPLERERDELAQERDQLKQQLEGLVVDNALNSAVSEIRVPSVYSKAVKAMFRNQVKVDTDESGNPVAVIEGEYGEQPVNKYLKDWAQTDEGKAFIEAQQSMGGGAGGGSGTAKGPNPFMKDQWNITEQSRIAREEPEKAKRMAQAAGVKPPRVA